ISRQIGHKFGKSMVSKWEADATINPNNAALLAMSAITGFAAKWLISGNGPKMAADSAEKTLSQAAMARALRIVLPDAPAGADVALATVYDIIVDAQDDISDAVLIRTAQAFLGNR
ncbi:MAG: hypothetical protein Q4G39_10335, partial [Brachymonas sp.]|nr:hypothetical protein [Brachymonas sp.]